MSNEAAEQLHTLVLQQGAKDGVSDSLSLLLDEALAAERRATVDELRKRISDYHKAAKGGREIDAGMRLGLLTAINIAAGMRIKEAG